MSGTRNVSDTFVTSSAPAVLIDFAAYMDFESGPLRVSTLLADASLPDDFGGGTYTAVGTLGSIGNIMETTEVSAKGISLTLSGVPSEYMAYALTDGFRGRDVAVYMILHSADFSTSEQICTFRGYMDTMEIDAANPGSITVTCENRLLQLNRPHDVRYTAEAQKRLYGPEDLGLEYLASSCNMDLYWGTAAPASAPSVTTATQVGANPSLGTTYMR